jgi:RcsF lipoprotein
MRSGFTYLVLFLSCAFLSCATAAPKTSPELRRAAAAVRLLDGAAPPGFRSAGEVEGRSCAERRGVNPDMAVAREKLKFEAASLRASAVANIACQEEGFSHADGCWKSIRCVGDAGWLP